MALAYIFRVAYNQVSAKRKDFKDHSEEDEVPEKNATEEQR